MKSTRPLPFVWLFWVAGIALGGDAESGKSAASPGATARVHLLCTERTDEHTLELQNLGAPKFLPALLAEAKAGNAQACLGLGSIADIGATRALVDLALSDDPAMARAAAFVLIPSLPVRSRPSLHVSVMTYPGQQVSRIWEEKWDAPLLLAAQKLLDPRSPVKVSTAEAYPVICEGFFLAIPDRITLGAQLIEARDDPAQGATLLAATQRALDAQLEARRSPEADVHSAPLPLYALIRAMDALRARGWRVDEAAASDRSAIMLARLRQFADPSVAAPEGNAWRDSVRTALNDKSPILRENAVRAIPLPLTEEWEGRLRAALQDRDTGVMYAACEVAEKSDRKSLIRPLVQMIEGVDHREVQSAAAHAAEKLGSRMELWQALCEVIPQESMETTSLEHLALGTIEFPARIGYSGQGGLTREQRFLVREAWQTFLAQNRTLLESGKRVPLNDPSVVPALTGSDFPGVRVVSVHMEDGTEWPPQDK